MPQEDIQHFLVDCFDDIKQTHPLRKHLKPEWPTAENLQQIVDKSSGQFVYASTVIKFVSMPSSSPSMQLEIVHGLRPAGRATPFAELDALYRHIFSQVEDITTVLRILAYGLFCPYQHLEVMSYFFRITEEDTESMLASLTSILSCDTDTHTIVFHHASLPDFLWDKERSQEYCISEMGTDLTILWFKNAASNRFSDQGHGKYLFFSPFSIHSLLISLLVSIANIINLKHFLSHAKASPNLPELMLKYIPRQTPQGYDIRFWTREVLYEVKKMVCARCSPFYMRVILWTFL